MGDEHTKFDQSKAQTEKCSGLFILYGGKVPSTEKIIPLEASNKMHLFAGH